MCSVGVPHVSQRWVCGVLFSVLVSACRDSHGHHIIAASFSISLSLPCRFRTRSHAEFGLTANQDFDDHSPDRCGLAADLVPTCTGSSTLSFR